MIQAPRPFYAQMSTSIHNDLERNKKYICMYMYMYIYIYMFSLIVQHIY